MQDMIQDKSYFGDRLKYSGMKHSHKHSQLTPGFNPESVNQA